MDVRSWIEHRAFGLAIGLAITAGAAVFFHLGAARRLDDFNLDLHLRHDDPISVDPRITLIDIDDTSLDVVSRWPWPRRRMAQLVRALSTAGAEVIVLDSVFVDPAAPRVVHAGLEANHDVDTGLAEYGDRATDEIVDDDQELRQAIAQSGNVYLGMFGALETPGRRAAPAAQGEANRFKHAAVDLLRSHFAADPADAEKLLPPRGKKDRVVLDRIWLDAKSRVARTAAKRFLADHATGTFAKFVARMLPRSEVAALGADRTILLDAFQSARAERLLADIPFPAGDTPGIRWPEAQSVSLPLPSLVKAARGVGWVAYGRESGDGVLRSLPMLVRGDDGCYASLGLLVACDVLGLDLHEASVTGRALQLGGGDATRSIPIERDGDTLIAWHRAARGGRWYNSFTHWPAHRALRTPMLFEAIEQNERRIGLLLGALVEERHRETPAAYNDYATRANEWWLRRRARLRAMQFDAVPSPQAKLAWRDPDVAAVEQEALVWLQRTWSLWRDEQPQTNEERVQRQAVERWHRRIVDEDEIGHLLTLDAGLGDEARVAADELGRAASGKICLVGNTATSVADLVTTPVDSSMPGVMAHANVINMVLRNRLVRRASWLIQIALFVLLGLGATVTANRLPLAKSLLLTVLASGAVFVLAWVVFRSSGLYLSTIPAAAAAALAWVGVSAHREFTQERVRRFVERALSQYTAPEIAGRIAKDPELRRLVPQSATITCFFCDLEGFTGLSERLGPSATRDTLNPYLERMSAILVAHGAIVNKFIGDGIFAFFNAPICPCGDHARAAVAAAWECRRALAQLPAAPSGPSGEPSGGGLRMRIGLATGEVFVGNYGSDAKLDYTCIGDRVNLAARLEKANKLIGSTILMDKATREAVGEDWAVGSFGRLRVPGRSQPVEAFELLGPSGTVDDEAIEAVEQLSRAIRRFQACDWGQAKRAFSDLGDHKAAALYLDAVAQLEASPPGADWDGALELRTD